MTEQEFRAQMLAYAIGTAKILAECAASADIKIEPEQLRKNASTILTILVETEDFLDDFATNKCSSSAI